MNDHQPKLPSPKLLTDIMERSKREKPSKIPSPRRKNYKSIDIPDTSPPGKLCYSKQQIMFYHVYVRLISSDSSQGEKELNGMNK